MSVWMVLLIVITANSKSKVIQVGYAMGVEFKKIVVEYDIGKLHAKEFCVTWKGFIKAPYFII